MTKYERARVARVRLFLAGLKLTLSRMNREGAEVLYGRDCPSTVRARDIDVRGMAIRTGKNSRQCFGYEWAAYDDAEEFERWFAELRRDFFMVEPLRVDEHGRLTEAKTDA